MKHGSVGVMMWSRTQCFPSCFCVTPSEKTKPFSSCRVLGRAERRAMNRHLPDSEEEIANRYQITATKTERSTLCEAAGGQT